MVGVHCAIGVWKPTYQSNFVHPVRWRLFFRKPQTLYGAFTQPMATFFYRLSPSLLSTSFKSASWRRWWI